MPFAGIGAFLLFSAVRDRSVVPAAFGLVFGGVGVRQIVAALRARRSRESEGAVFRASPTLPAIQQQPALDYRSASRRTQAASEVYALLLQAAPLPKLTTTPGRTLAVALGAAPPKDSVFLLAFGVVWTGFTLPVLVGLLARGMWAGAAFLSLFFAVGLVVACAAIGKLLSRLALPRVEVSEEPVYLGDELRVHVEQRGPARITRLRVDLQCQECATCIVGDETRTEVCEVFERELLDDPGRTLRLGEQWPHDLTVTLPADAPHSFWSKHNAISWSVRVRAEIAGWPDYDELFELRALPRIPS